MFEKLLQAIEQDPSRQKRQAFLALVSQVDAPAERAEALAQYGRILARRETLEALSVMRYAWRLSPGNPKILDDVKKLFLALRRGEAAAELETLRSTPPDAPLDERPLDLDLKGFLDTEEPEKTKGAMVGERTIASHAPDHVPGPAKTSPSREGASSRGVSEAVSTVERPRETTASGNDFLSSFEISQVSMAPAFAPPEPAPAQNQSTATPEEAHAQELSLDFDFKFEEPVVDSASTPDFRPAEKPVRMPPGDLLSIPEPMPEPMPEPIPEPMPKPIPEPMPEPIPEPVPEPIPEPQPDLPQTPGLPEFPMTPETPEIPLPSPPTPAPSLGRTTAIGEIALTFSEVNNRKHYALFMEFVRATGIDFRLLEFAEGFSDSLLGLVHFLHYLKMTCKIPDAKLKNAVANLRGRVMCDLADIKSQVRFLDLFEPPNGEG